MEMVDLVDDSKKSSHSIQGYTHFPNFEMLDARIASALKKDHTEYPLQEKSQSGGTESSKKRIVSFEEDRSLA